MRVRRLISELRDYERIAGIFEIARRYFLMNTFDGVMTVLGLVLGGLIAGSESPSTILKIGFGAGISMAVSGVWGAYVAEISERKREIKEISRAVMRDIEETKIGRAHRFASIVIAIVDGLSPVVAVSAALSPFFFTVLSIRSMYILSITICFSVLALLGIFSALIARERILSSAAKMLLAGVASAVLGELLLK